MAVQAIAVKAGRLIGLGVARFLIAKHATERGVTRARARWAVVAIPARDQGPIIGNIRTRVYHQATDRHLPMQARRVYFDSVEEAEAHGYRPASYAPSS